MGVLEGLLFFVGLLLVVSEANKTGPRKKVENKKEKEVVFETINFYVI